MTLHEELTALAEADPDAHGVVLTMGQLRDVLAILARHPARTVDRDAAWEARIAGRPARTDSPRRAFDDGWAAALSRHPAPVPALDREAVRATVGAWMAQRTVSLDAANELTDAIMALAPAESACLCYGADGVTDQKCPACLAPTNPEAQP